MSQREAAQALGEEQLLKQGRKAKQALNKANKNVKDMIKTREIVRQYMGVRFWWEGFQREGCGSRREGPCQTHQEQVQEQIILGHDGTGTRLGDRHKTSCQRDQKNRPNIFEHRNCDGKPDGSGGWRVLGNSISVERSFPPRVRRHDHVEGCSCLLNHRCCAHDLWCLSSPSFMFFACPDNVANVKVSTPCGDPLKDVDALTGQENLYTS